jgi:hypothetical protein
MEAAPIFGGLADEELGSATAIDPDTAAVDTPGVVLDARSAADLTAEADIPAITDVTPVSAAIVGRAGDDLRRRWRGWPESTAYGEIGAAATINPKAASVDAPGVVSDARRAADLPYQLGIASAANVTPVSTTVV